MCTPSSSAALASSRFCMRLLTSSEKVEKVVSPPHKACNDKQAPFGGQAGMGLEELAGYAYEQAADQVGGQGAQRKGRQNRVQPHAQQPAQQRADSRAQRDGDDDAWHGLVCCLAGDVERLVGAVQ